MATKKKQPELANNPLSTYAAVSWSIADIKDRKPKWSDAKCEEWLSDHEDTLQEVMISRGWDYIDMELQ